MPETNPLKPGFHSASNQLLLRKEAEGFRATLEALDDEIYEAVAHSRPVDYLMFVQARTATGWAHA